MIKVAAPVEMATLSSVYYVELSTLNALLSAFVKTAQGRDEQFAKGHAAR